MTAMDTTREVYVLEEKACWLLLPVLNQSFPHPNFYHSLTGKLQDVFMTPSE